MRRVIRSLFAHFEAKEASKPPPPEAFGAARRSAFACYEQVPDGERTWCEADLKALADR